MSFDLSVYQVVSAPASLTRLIPSRYPPVRLFDSIASSDDLRDLFELEGWTNDRLVQSRLSQLPESQWAYGRPNSSIIMSAFLHGSPSGLRFSDSTLGAWYCSTQIETALLEVANGLRKEVHLSGIVEKAETYRQYKCDLGGGYADIFSLHPEFHDPDDGSYPLPQSFGKAVRLLGPSTGISGIRYQSVRRPGHENWVCFIPPDIQNVVQADHFKMVVRATGPVSVQKLS